MRTVLITLLMLLTLAGCASKDEAATEAAVEQATEEGVEAAEEAAAQSEAEVKEAESEDVALSADLFDGPLGKVVLKDGSELELTRLGKFYKYFIYISGKLNGRSSTVISLTRLRDLQRWAGIGFDDPNNFTIITAAKKELRFEDARVYIGSDSPDTYTFYTTEEGGFDTKKITVNKRDVQIIKINPPSQED